MALNETNKDKKSKMYLFIMILLLFLINVGLIYKLVTKNNQLEITTTELENTSAELDEVNALQEELKIQLADKIGKNAKLDSIINLRDAQIQKKVVELKRMLTSNKLSKADLAKARDEITSLRSQITSLTEEIEKLSKENQFLKDENYVMQKQVEAEKEKVSEMVEVNTDLTRKVELGSQIFLKNLQAVPMRKSIVGDYKTTDKINKVDKIDVSFAMANNNLASKGEKTLYFQLVTPSKSTIHSSEAGSGKFNYDGGDRLYTVKRVVNFQNKNEFGSFSIPKAEGMTAGKYTLKVYSDSHIMGSTSFTLR
jgi:hypothetical protein